MRSSNIKRSVIINGRDTSLTLEGAFWSGLGEIAYRKGCTIGTLLAQIDAERAGPNLPSAIRVYVLEYFKAPKRARCATN
ncbi:MAG: ribbon-helix-helix domain-containing protein [Sphingomicrobium sp.]